VCGLNLFISAYRDLTACPTELFFSLRRHDGDEALFSWMDAPAYIPHWLQEHEIPANRFLTLHIQKFKGFFDDQIGFDFGFATFRAGAFFRQSDPLLVLIRTVLVIRTSF
jgi:hypothetical protein